MKWRSAAAEGGGGTEWDGRQRRKLLAQIEQAYGNHDRWPFLTPSPSRFPLPPLQLAHTSGNDVRQVHDGALAVRVQCSQLHHEGSGGTAKIHGMVEGRQIKGHQHRPRGGRGSGAMGTGKAQFKHSLHSP